MKKSTSYLCLLLPFFLIHDESFAQQPFTIETIQSSGEVGQISSLAIDIDGYPHVSYYEGNSFGGSLKYANWDGSNWEIQVVDNVLDLAGIYNSIALDSDGRPHIAYTSYDGPNATLNYGHWDGNQWHLEIVHETGNVGVHPSIALDDKDFPHISYIDDQGGKLLYAQMTNAGWEISTVDVEGQSGFDSALRYTSIVLDRFNYAHISYSSDKTRSLKYAQWNGAVWNVSTLQSDDWIQRTAIALDQDDTPHIAYCRSGGRKGLRYASIVNGVWQFQELEPDVDSRGYPSIAIDHDGFPHIGYGDGRQLKYAFEDMSGWHFQTVYTGSGSGNNIEDRSIGLDCNGNPYMSFYENGVRDLKFARPPSYGPDPFSLVSPANGAYTTNTPSFQWELSSYQGTGLTQYELHIDGVFSKSIPATRCSTSVDSPLADGIHTWRIRAVLSAGGEIWSNETWSIQVDSTPPQAFDLLSPADDAWTATRRPEFAWQASDDAGSGINKYQLFVDDQLNVDDILPSATSTMSSFDLTDGDHSWHIIAIDNALNQTQSNQTSTIKVDATPPMVFSLTSPSDLGWTGDTTPTFSWEATSDDGIGLSKYQLHIDANVAVDSISKETTSIILDQSQALTGGNHTWQVKAYDELNNVRQSSTWTIRVDVTSPATFSLSSPPDSSAASFPTPEFTWNASQDFESGFSHYQLWIDNNLSVDNITNTKSAPGSPLTEGVHSWYVNAVDNVSNTRQSDEVWTVIWDPTPPDAFDLSSPADGDTVAVQRPLLSWNPSSDAGSGITRYELWINGEKNKDVPPSETSSTPANDLDNGQYTWFVKAVDFAENSTSSTSTRNLVVNRNLAAPSISSLSISSDPVKAGEIAATINFDPGTGEIDNSVTPTVTFRPANDTTKFIIQQTSFQGATWIGTAIIDENLNNGTATIQVSGIQNTLGNTIAPLDNAGSFVIDTVDPVAFELLSPPDSSWTSEGSPTLSWNPSSDVTSGLAFYNLFIDSELNVGNISPSQFAILPAEELDDGGYFWKVLAIDNAGNTQESNSTWLISVDNTPPTSEITSPTSGEGVSGTVIIEGTANDGLGIGVDSVFVSTDDGGTWYLASKTSEDFTNWRYEWNVSQDGQTTLLTQAIDKLGNEETAHGINVTDIKDRTQSSIPIQFGLLQNYPNPFNPQTMIEYRVPEKSLVTIRIYNISGQEVLTLINQEKEPGYFNTKWNGRDLYGNQVATGIYVYQMKAGNFVASKKLILIQ